MNNEQSDTKYLLEPFDVEYKPVTELVVNNEKGKNISEIKKDMIQAGIVTEQDFKNEKSDKLFYSIIEPETMLVKMIPVNEINSSREQLISELKKSCEEYSLSKLSVEDILVKFDYQNNFENMVDRIRKVFSENRKITPQTIRQETSNLDVILMAYFTEQEQNVSN